MLLCMTFQWSNHQTARLICNISHKLLRPSQFLEKFTVHFGDVNQAPSTHLILQHIGKVATKKLVPINCLKYLQTALIIRGRGLVSKIKWIIVDYCSSLCIENRNKVVSSINFSSSSYNAKIFYNLKVQKVTWTYTSEDIY